jgi:hypothetical protein
MSPFGPSILTKLRYTFFQFFPLLIRPKLKQVCEILKVTIGKLRIERDIYLVILFQVIQ